MSSTDITQKKSQLTVSEQYTEQMLSKKMKEIRRRIYGSSTVQKTFIKKHAN
jgi:hypothetical protein